MKYAAVTSCTQNYSQYLEALLVSADKYNHDFDLYVFCINMDEEFLQKIQNRKWSFNLFLKRHTEYKKDFNEHEGNHYPKKVRYSFAGWLAPYYQALLFLDVDMMFTNNIMRFFELVDGTDYLLGCNERFKWGLQKFYLLDNGKQELLPQLEMYWMICNAPLFISQQNAHFWSRAEHAATVLRRESDDKVPSDLFTMNVALWLAGLQDKVIPLPSYCWTGVHNGYINIYTRIVKKNGRWQSISGEPVYMIHGRWDKEGCENYYLKEQEKRYAELGLQGKVLEKHRKLTDKTIQLIKDEFHANRILDKKEPVNDKGADL